MKFILQSGNWSPQWQTIRDCVPKADQLGFWGFLMPDHYMWGSDRGGDSTLETWIVLTYLAARTEKLKLGTLVTPIPFRPPGMLAKEISTIDLISEGRAILGVGAGWSVTEFEGYSEWNDPKTRVDKTQEGVELILKLWTERGKVNHEGKYYKAKNAVLDPKPVQKPHPPLLFGGVGKRMLRMAGRYGDIICIPPWLEDMSYEQAKETVLSSARKYSRNPSDLSFARIQWGREKYDRRQFEEKAREAQDSGSEFLIVNFPRESYEESMVDFAKNVIPSFS